MNFQFSKTYCSFPQTLISSPLINFLQTLERSTLQWSSKTHGQLTGRDEVKYGKQACLLN